MAGVSGTGRERECFYAGVLAVEPPIHFDKHRLGTLGVNEVVADQHIIAGGAERIDCAGRAAPGQKDDFYGDARAALVAKSWTRMSSTV